MHHPNHSLVAILIMTCCDLKHDVHIIKQNELFVFSQWYWCKFGSIPSNNSLDIYRYQADQPFFAQIWQ